MVSQKAMGSLFLTALLVCVSALTINIQAQTSPADMRDAALVIGNLGFTATDGVLRYNSRGEFIDNMVPTGTEGNVLPCCMTFGPDENLYLSNPLMGRVQRFNGITGAFIDEFVPAGSGGLAIPLVLLFRDGYLYVGDTGAGAIRRYDAKTGAYVDNFIPENSQGMGNFGDLQHFVFGPDGNLYVAAGNTKRVLRYDGHTGSFIDEIVPNSQGYDASGLAFGPDGLLYVGSYALGEIRRYDVTSKTYEIFIPAGGRLAPFGPVGFLFGPDGYFYTTSVGTQEILRYDVTGRFLGAFISSGLGGLSGPRTITWKVKTRVCHKNDKTLSIGYFSGIDHLAHGDTLGPCE